MQNDIHGALQSNDRLTSLIFTHWRNYRPKMLAQFRAENRLNMELEAAAQGFADLLYELTVVQKMSYQAAWEIAIEQFLLPEEEELSSTSWNQSSSLHATSE